MSERSLHTEEHNKKESAAFQVVLAYAVLGPPLGWVMFVVTGAFGLLLASLVNGDASAVSAAEVIRSAPQFVGLLVLGVPLSYVFGFVRALLAGIVLAVLLRVRGRAGYIEALLAPLALGLIMDRLDILEFPVMSNLDGLLTFIGVVSSLVLRYWFRGLFVRAGVEWRQSNLVSR